MTVVACDTAPVTSTPVLTRFGGGMVDGYLTTADIAARLGVQPQTVRKYRTDSQAGRRYADRPFPAPDRTIGHMPVWNASRLPEIRAWVAARPGQGVGGGSPSHKARADRLAE